MQPWTPKFLLILDGYSDKNKNFNEDFATGIILFGPTEEDSSAVPGIRRHSSQIDPMCPNGSFQNAVWRDFSQL